MTLPRLFARYSHKAEWSLGHILRAVPLKGAGDRWKRNFPASVIPDELYNTTMETGSEDSHTLYSHTHLVLDEKTRQVEKPSQPKSWSTRLHSGSALLGYPMAPGYSVGRVIVMLGYFLVILYASVYKSSPFSDFTRTGYVAMAQFPIVVALATKNNILGMFLAVGYEKLNYLHRFAGRLLALAGSLHAIGYFYKWSLAGTFQSNISKPMFIYGFVSLMGLNLLVFFSTPFWRHRCYNVFLFSHILGFILFPVGLCLHTPDAIPWVSAAIIIYGVDHFLRIIKSRISEVTLRPMADLGLTRIEVPHVNAGWRAGQHVRLRVLSSGMGIFGWAEVHPFTIASVGGDGMVLMAKKAGGWTTKLYGMATGGASAEKGVVGRNAKVIIEGPYGGIGHTMMETYSGALFVAGGSGITFALAAVQELIQKDIAGKSHVKVIELVWCVQNAGSLMSMLPTFTSLVQQAPFTKLHISVYYTRSSMSADPTKLYGYLPPSIVLTPGRPRIQAVLDTVVDQTTTGVTKPSGFLVGVCGPVSLGEQVRSAVGKIDSGRREAVGGVELCEEVFGW